VDDVRELREQVKFLPTSCKYKIIIIDEVHMLSNAAFNALLKTLEEPPAHVIFIFATTSPKNIPVTVLSRCQHLNFRRIAKARIMDHLAYICEQEKVTITAGALEMIARVGEGSVRDSLTVLDQAVAFSTNIQESDLQTMLGLPEQAVIYELGERLLQADRTGLLELVAELAEGGADLRSFPKEIVSLFRNLLVVKVSEKPASLLELPEDELLDLKALAEQAETEELTLMLNEYLKLEDDIRGATNPRYLLELSLIRGTFLKGATSISTLLDQLESGDASVALSKAPMGTREPAPRNWPEKKSPATLNREDRADPDSASPDKGLNEEPPSETLETTAKSVGMPPEADPERFRMQLIRHLRGVNHPLATRLSQGQMVRVSSEEITLEFKVPSADFYVDSLKRGLPAIEASAAAVAGHRLRVRLVAGTNGNGEKKQSGSEFRESVLKEPLVQSAMELFDAKVVDIKPLDEYIENGGNDV